MIESTEKLERTRRSAETASNVEASLNVEEDDVVRVYFKRSCQRQTILSCAATESDQSNLDKDIKVVCTKITCRVGRLTQNNTVRIHLTGWLWTASFFKLHLPDINLVSRLSVAHWGTVPANLKSYLNGPVNLNFADPPPAYEMTQSVVFRGVTGKHLDRIPLWPILTGVVAGSIMLFAMIALLYYCGFFQRRKKTLDAKKRHTLTQSVLAASAAKRSDSPPLEFLFNESNKKNGHFAKNGTSNGVSVGDYTGNPMVAGSPDLLYAHSPQPPSPPPENDEDAGSNDWLVSPEKVEGEKVPLLSTKLLKTDEPEEAKVKLLDSVDKPEESVETTPVHEEGRTNRAAGDEIPDWLLTEVEQNTQN